MRHARMPCASLSRCGKVVSSSSASDWKYPLSCSMLLSGTFLPLSTPPLCLLLFFSPRSFLPYTFFALTLERDSFIPTIACLPGVISLRNSWAVPSKCAYADCTGKQVRLHQPVSKALRDTAHRQVEVHRYRCLKCGRTFRVYPLGVTPAQSSERVKGLAVMLYLLGLSYGAVALALERVARAAL
jgi:hypothetical protein